MNIAIAGYGLEGRANLEYFRAKYPDATFTIFDENPHVLDNYSVNEEVLFVGGEGAFDKIQGFDMVVRTAGLLPNKIAQTDKHWSSTREFFAECPVPIIGVTGTKGKGTTCTMTRDILRADGRKVYLVGNIGVPALEVLPRINPNDAVVYELSSFQLCDLDTSPHTAVVVRIEAEHVDIHGDFASYINAKSNITKHQTSDDTVIYYEKNKYSQQIADLSPGHKIPYPDDIEFNEKILKVPGVHYVENAKAAIAAVRDILRDKTSIEKGLSNFRAMPHRLELVRELDGVKYYDDNFSTGFPSLEVAVKALAQNDIVLIAGGKDRGLNNYGDIAQAINNSTVKQVFLIGETAPKIAAKLHIEHKICSTLTEAILKSHQAAKPGDVVLMSPGAASFDMFESFYDRAEQFQKEVKKL